MIKTYEEFREGYHKKYSAGHRCYVCGSKNAFYEGGDSRFWCAMCEKCVGIPKAYKQYIDRIEKQKKIIENTKIKKYNEYVNNFNF